MVAGNDNVVINLATGLEGLMTEAVAKAAGLPAEAVRRAVMLSENSRWRRGSRWSKASRGWWRSAWKCSDTVPAFADRQATATRKSEIIGLEAE
jgi:hypothetical protein